MEMTHLSLFSGIGGLDLAAEMAGFRTVAQCEWADYPTKVLEKHWPGVTRWRDIRELTRENFYERTGLRTVDVISGGFPCQPFSVAGKRRGKEDNRYLWPEMLRIIKELQPSWTVGENVAGIVNMALDTVLADLETIGYSVRAFVIPACGVDAPHRRYRVAIVGHSKHNGLSSSKITGGIAKTSCNEPQREGKASKFAGTSLCGYCEDVADPDCVRLQGQWPGREQERRTRQDERALERCGDVYGYREWWPVEPNVGRVANGVPARVDRLKCLGNAVVPQQFYPIFRAIAKIAGNKEQ